MSLTTSTFLSTLSLNLFSVGFCRSAIMDLVASTVIHLKSYIKSERFIKIHPGVQGVTDLKSETQMGKIIRPCGDGRPEKQTKWIESFFRTNRHMPCVKVLHWILMFFFNLSKVVSLVLLYLFILFIANLFQRLNTLVWEFNLRLSSFTLKLIKKMPPHTHLHPSQKPSMKEKQLIWL